MPTDAELETSLRDAVRALYDDPDASVRRIRAKAEEDLSVEEGFFKNEEWKERSKQIIQDQFDRKEEEQQRASKTKKRPSPSTQGSRPRKKSRVEDVREEEEESSTALSEPPESDEQSEEEPPKKKTKAQQQKAGKPAKSVKKAAPKKEKPKPKAKKPASSESELSDAPSEPADDKEEEEAEANPAAKAQDDNDDISSELSSVIDDPEPVKKKSKAKNGDVKSSSKQRRSSTSTKSKSGAEPDPNSEEIKRLQGWLVKCGIRKVWGKELKPFNTPKAKIAHLKKMLSDVGMTGRYSNEKAAQIKEARELAADIEAVQEGNERWGKGEDGSADEEDGSGKDGGRPRRRLVRGAANYDFLSSDGEETD
ncbi:hypothetical protein LTR70_004252 [Exophiala xenobiotica]|uniref:Transcriptional regulator n=1 Tax=Lithohypha guttulata TaxID=1690604 RepID=A0ABR0KFM6_9EURO|nr:hypothetical protein LTR24_003781 [Lithohypha guttulata]KAK5321007.1 hypothetical protein LTR70_004252 [Exophiala xenobiotica]